ncbi:hypothetical protein RA269_27665 [Pseudomonas syringae pv. tagetis]|uniref:hypothetical protein n=1 Tax=Pseudomonas syringae group genomosp. 7 TaxID=251699 RepID=UPI00376F527A
MLVVCVVGDWLCWGVGCGVFGCGFFCVSVVWVVGCDLWGGGFFCGGGCVVGCCVCWCFCCVGFGGVFVVGESASGRGARRRRTFR